jgi:hypothetical protein
MLSTPNWLFPAPASTPSISNLSVAIILLGSADDKLIQRFSMLSVSMSAGRVSSSVISLMLFAGVRIQRLRLIRSVRVQRNERLLKAGVSD